VKIGHFLIFLLFSFDVFAYDFEQFNQEITKPVKDEQTQKVLLGGAVLTGLSLLKRRPYLKTFERRQHKSQSLGKWAEFGDLVGQLIPNAAYFLYNYNLDTFEGKRRAWGMFKATAYSGLTTTVLKYTIQAPRPGSNPERNSFPSGHSSTIFAFSGYVLQEHGLIPGAFAMGLASFCAYSRIHDRMHRVHEVVAGATIGLAYGIVMAKLHSNKTEEEMEEGYTISPIVNINPFFRDLGLSLVKSW